MYIIHTNIQFNLINICFLLLPHFNFSEIPLYSMLNSIFVVIFVSNPLHLINSAHIYIGVGLPYGNGEWRMVNLKGSTLLKKIGYPY